MSYTKPEIILAGATIMQIQGTFKNSQFSETHRVSHATPAAYEADE